MVQHYSKKNSCNIEIRTKLNMCCKDQWSNVTCWCPMDKGRIGSFESMKGRLREAFSKSNYSTPTQLSLRLQDLLGVDNTNVTTTGKASYSLIVWHLRVGDIILNARHEYFSNIATQLSYAFQNSTMIPLIVFLAQGGEKGELFKSFPFLPSLCHDLFSNNCFYPNMDVRDSLYHMIQSDVLITSGSSFAAMAGLLRSNGMTLAARSKEGVVGIYETSEQLLIDKDGTIAKIGALKEYIEQQSVFENVTDDPEDSITVVASNKNNKTSEGRAPAILSNTTTDCIRFATMLPLNGNTGLGHRFSEVILGMKFAQEVNATYLYNKDTWTPIGKHGGYNWTIDFLPLHYTEVTRNDHIHRQQQQDLQVIQGQWEWMVQHYSKKNSCNIEIRTKLNMCCKDQWSNVTCWCPMDKGRIGSFESMKGRLREAFSKSNYSTPTQLSLRLQDLLGVDNTNVTTTGKASYSLIVWHLRVGDIILNARHEYFSNIATQLSYAFQNSTMIPLIVFLAQGGEKGELFKSFPFLPSLCHDLFSNNCFYPNMDVRDSLYHMIQSDVLITSGSSFAAMAGLLRSNGMTLAARSKEGVVGIYETSEQLLIDKDGTIAKIGALKEYIEQQSVSHHISH